MGIDDFAVFILDVRVLALGIFTNHASYACHSCACEVILPVELDEGRKNERKGKLYLVIAAVFLFELYVIDARCFVCWFSSNSAENMAVDVEMGEIYWIILFGCDLICACCCRINCLHTENGCLSKFACACAFFCAERTHTGLWGDEITAVFSECEAAGKSW